MMKPLKIASVAVFHQRVQGTAPNYTSALTAVCKKVPRRITRFIQLTLLGAHQCAGAAGTPLVPDCGIYLASAKGNTEDTVSLLRQVFHTREIPNPVTFINVSNNLAGYYLAQTLALHGRNLSVSRRDFPFEAALELACLDVGDGTVPMGLVGAVDQATTEEWTGINSTRAESPAQSDASVWMLLDPACSHPMGEIHWVRRASTVAELVRWPSLIDLAAQSAYLALGPGISPEERPSIERLFPQWSPFPYGGDVPDYGTLGALGMGSFIQAGVPGHLLHVAGNGQGGYYGVWLTATGRSGTRSATR